MDPVTALATASTAFNLIKKGFQAGRDVESMYGDIGKWLGAVSDVNQAEKMSKNPPLFKKLFLTTKRVCTSSTLCKCLLLFNIYIHLVFF